MELPLLGRRRVLLVLGAHPAVEGELDHLRLPLVSVVIIVAAAPGVPEHLQQDRRGAGRQGGGIDGHDSQRWRLGSGRVGSAAGEWGQRAGWEGSPCGQP